MEGQRTRRAALVLGIAAVMALHADVDPTARAQGSWYVTTAGSDDNACSSPAAPCATLAGALNKPGFAAVDTVYVAMGTYTGTVGEVALIDKSASISGGWDDTFTQQNGLSTIDGQERQRGITINGAVTVTLQRLLIQNGSADWGGGILNQSGTLTVDGCQLNTNHGGRGGAIWNEGGTLTVTNSALIENSAGGPGGGLYNNMGHSTLCNVTFSGNSAWVGGGIFNSNHGRVVLNQCTFHNNTVANYSGAAIDMDSGNVVLRGSIVAQQHKPGESACQGEIQSAGHNLIQSWQACPVGATTGDIGNVDARLFSLMGTPAHHPLLRDSPAIDRGDPAGCLDYFGSPVSVDQRGQPRPVDGDGDGAAICDMGAYEYDPASAVQELWLSLVARDHCPPIVDHFDNLASGWPVGEDPWLRTEYLEGQYRIFTKQSGYLYLFGSPSCRRRNYVVEIKARWWERPGDSYGLIFGLSNDWSQYYLFYVSSDLQAYALLRRDSSGFTVLQTLTEHPMIAYENVLRVTRRGPNITLEINGTQLGTWSDGSISGLTRVGIYVIPYDDRPICDARFDDFSVASLQSSTIPVTAAAATGQTNGLPGGWAAVLDRLPPEEMRRANGDPWPQER